MKESGVDLRESSVWGELKRFVSEKRRLAEEMCVADAKEMLPEFKTVFDAAENGDLQRIENILGYLRWLQPGADHRDLTKYCLRGQWQIASEVWGVFREFGGGGQKFVAAFGRDVIASIPPGSIYFGGTDAGRFAVTALCESHTKAIPFFTLTQCALADKTYLSYVRSIYGERIYLPTAQDCTVAYDNYVQDALKRQKENKLKPGEFPLKEVDGKFEIQGITGVMAINSAMSKLTFDKNPDREFYIEESFPLDWMFPHLTPNGLIMKINREPLAVLSEEVLQRDREHWTRYVWPMIGDWLAYDTPVAEVAGFAEKVRTDAAAAQRYRADAEYLQSSAPQRAFAKARSSIGGIYAWRRQNANSQAEKERMVREADFVFRQAIALFPCSPEAVFRYVNLLLGEKRFDDAILVAESAAKSEPIDPNFRNIAEQLRRMKAAAVQTVA
jgi:hypothetical protein